MATTPSLLSRSDHCSDLCVITSLLFFIIYYLVTSLNTVVVLPDFLQFLPSLLFSFPPLAFCAPPPLPSLLFNPF